MSVRTSRHNAAIIIGVHGEIDMLTAPRLRSPVVTAIRQARGNPVVIDLTGVTFLGTHGLAVLRTIAEADGAGGPIRIVTGGNQFVHQAITVSGLDGAFTLYSSLEDALPAR